MSLSQRRVAPTLGGIGLLALAFFAWNALREPEPQAPRPPDQPGKHLRPPPTVAIDPPGTHGNSAAPAAVVDPEEARALQLLDAMRTWDAATADEIVRALKPDPMRKLAGIIRGKGSSTARTWAIQIAAALSADPNWTTAPDHPPPQPAPIDDPQLREAIASAARDPLGDERLRVTALAALPFELGAEGRPVPETAELLAWIVEREPAGSVLMAAFDRLHAWFGSYEMGGGQGLEKYGPLVQNRALELLARPDEPPEARRAAIRALRWANPVVAGPALIDRLGEETDADARRAMFEVLESSAPGAAARAWGDGVLAPTTDAEQQSVSAIVGRALKEAPGDAVHYAVAKVRLQERLAVAGRDELVVLIASTAAVAQESAGLKRDVREFLRGQRARADVTEAAAEALDRVLDALGG
jgi:hypothetical protein